MTLENIKATPSFAVLTQIAFWIVLFGFIVSLSAVMLDWPQVFYRSIFALMCHLVNFYFFYSFLIPIYFEKGQYFQFAIGFLIIIVIITPLRIGVERFFVIKRPAFNMSIGAHAKVGFILFSEITIAAFASLLRLAASRQQLRVRMNDLEKSELETELRFLKGQMSPHFLFNTINNIYSLVLIKSDHAPDALMKLSGLLRYLLYESDQKVALSREIEALKTYRDLFQLKFQEPLNLIWKIDIADWDRTIEPLTLVPILENAIKHSGLGLDPDADVHFSVKTDGNLLTVMTRNSISRSAIHGETGGIGLANIRRRLDKTFPNNHKIEIEQTKSRFVLYLEMPLL